ncbi:TetR family transcriptional regulator C-terminal domain-containing protein [Persicobacter psychrovividus]|uniref:Tetracyclin repressor-like C-terminal domain-containing protein n=1 Tax=Persicobacter psychrovividus TaxID=387638 RepID=A0ABN6L841_9BACT|nr:hypothetical protein PEPS_16300 [Persicobacter psychrovividus]
MAKKTVDLKEKIKHEYLDYYLTKGHDPKTVYHFCKELKIKEEAYYEHYNSFAQIRADIWRSLFLETKKGIMEDDVYSSYSVREKLLAFYYTLGEMLKSKRSFVVQDFPRSPKEFIKKSQIKAFKEPYLLFVQDLVQEGIETGEIKSRSKLEAKYKEALWAQCVFIIDFWTKDDSEQFEATDAAIEKAVNLSFELMGASALDSILDFGKFLFHNRDKMRYQ